MREMYGDWRDVFKGFRIALDPRKITLGVGGVFLSGILCFFAVLAILVIADDGVRQSLVSGRIDELVAQSKDTLIYGLASEPRILILLGVVIFLVQWFVWAYFGGAICRIAAVEVARDERIELNEALKFAGEKYRSLFWSPMAVVGAIAFFGLCNVAVGLLGRILPWGGLGQLLMSVPLVVALFSGFLMALLLVGLVAGFPLMAPTVCVEGTDAFDAISRSVTYIYARPWRYLWCRLTACVYGIPCAAFVVAFTMLFVHMGTKAGALGMGKEFEAIDGFWRTGIFPGTVLGNIGAVAYAIWIYIIAASVIGYLVSYFFTSNTLIYLILRKVEDGTEMTEVYEEEEEEKREPEAPAEEEKEKDDSGTGDEEKEKDDPGAEQKEEDGKAEE